MNMEIRYERDLVHAYMVLPAGEDGGYRRRMILENRIPGFLPVQRRCCNDREEYYYNISSQVSLEEYLEHNPLSSVFLRQLIFAVCRLAFSLREYLLAEDCLALGPETIFYTEETETFFLCLYPDARQDVRDSLRQLLKYLMEKADKEEEQCGILCYELYGLLQKKNFCLREFLTVMEEKPAPAQPKEAEKKKRTKQIFASRRNGGIMKAVRREA